LKKYQVRVTSEAEKDIEDIYDYIAKKDSNQNAEFVFNKIEGLILALNQNPERGNYPPELSRQGIHEYREVMFKPYRIIYETLDSKVIVHICADGRRDMKSLLERRLLR